jgi:hypothetical protein
VLSSLIYRLSVHRRVPESNLCKVLVSYNVILFQSLCSAELRLYQQGQSNRQPQRLEVLLRGLYVLDSKQLGHNVRGWKNFNVYDAFIDDNSLPEVNTKQQL